MHQRLRVTLALLAVLVLGLAVGCGRAAQTTPPPAATSADSVTRPEIGFRSVQKLEEHFRKHGREFGDIDQARYLRLAQSLRDRPVGGTVIEARRGDGVITRFDSATGAFLAANGDGTIRTFFRPNDGIDYFRRQARR